jgi:hypothetical protein
MQANSFVPVVLATCYGRVWKIICANDSMGNRKSAYSGASVYALPGVRKMVK